MASLPWVRLVLLLLAAVPACHGRPFFDDDVDKIMTTEPLPPSMISCSTAGNYSDGSQYHVNLDRLLSSIPMAAANDGGFFSGKFGVEGDEVFGLFMCYAGDTDSECQDCLTRAPAGVMKLCPHSRTVGAVYNACTLRYSDESFFSVADLVDISDLSDAPRMEVERSSYRTDSYRTQYQRGGDSYAAWYEGVLPLVGYVVDTAGMSRMRSELIHRLMGKAGQAAERIAEGKQRFTDMQWVWAVAQCTRDLPASECTRCLSYYADQLPRLFPNNSGGAIKGYSCYLGYAILADKPSTVRLNRYRFSESYQREMAAKQAADELQQKHVRERETMDRESRRRKRRQKIATIIIIVVITVVLVVCLVGLLVWFLWYRWRRWVAAAKVAMKSFMEKLKKEAVYFRGKSARQDELEQGTGPRRFRYAELAAATDGFSGRNKLGEGGFGSVYRGFLQNMNLHIAVKKVSKSSRQGWKEFVSEVRIISRLRHRNLVPLVGWFYGGDDEP